MQFTSLLFAVVLLCAIPTNAFNYSQFSIGVLSDSPYGINQTFAIGKLTRSLNEFPTPLKTVVHLGDFKDGHTGCNDSYFQWVQDDFFSKIDAPLVFTPGDNDWTDCHRFDNGQFNPLDRLDAIRTIFFRQPLLSTAGKTRQRVDSQMLYPPYNKYVENAVWTTNGVVFGTLHTVGSNNGRFEWDRLPNGDLPGPRIHEYLEREEASLAWIDVIFDRAESIASPGVAIFTQAGMWPAYELANDIPLNGFDRIVQRLAKRASKFDKPVWLINGDQHDWVVFKPFTPGATHPQTGLYGKENMSLYRFHGEEYDAPKVVAFTLETYQKYDAGKDDYDPDYAFDWFELKVKPQGGEDVFSYERHKVRYSDYE